MRWLTETLHASAASPAPLTAHDQKPFCPWPRETRWRVENTQINSIMWPCEVHGLSEMQVLYSFRKNVVLVHPRIKPTQQVVPEVTCVIHSGVTALTFQNKTFRVISACRCGQTGQKRQIQMHHIRHRVVTLAHCGDMSKVGGTLVWGEEAS